MSAIPAFADAPARTLPRVMVLAALTTLAQSVLLARLQFDGVRPMTALVVTVLGAMQTGPRSGAYLGLFTGIGYDLLLDVRLGTTALVLCLVGYLVGRARAGAFHGAQLVPAVLLLIAGAAGAALLPLAHRAFGVPLGGLRGYVRSVLVVLAWTLLLGWPLHFPVRRVVGLR